MHDYLLFFLPQILLRFFPFYNIQSSSIFPNQYILLVSQPFTG